MSTQARTKVLLIREAGQTYLSRVTRDRYVRDVVFLELKLLFRQLIQDNDI
jgi:hypothetical protein